MPVIPLTGTRREKVGKGAARKMRAAGLIPAVLYGRGETPVAVHVSARDFELAVHRQGGNPIIGLSLGDGEYNALIRDVQYDPITHEVIHLDFQHISLSEAIEVEVPIHLVGTAVGVKDAGGILEPILRALAVRCLPTAIPAFLELDVSSLNIGDSVHVSAISVPADVTVVTESDVTVATVVPPTVHVEEKPAEEAAAAAATEGEPTEPEVIAKGKKEEGEAEETKGGRGGKEGKEGKEK